MLLIYRRTGAGAHCVCSLAQNSCSSKNQPPGALPQCACVMKAADTALRPPGHTCNAHTSGAPRAAGSQPTLWFAVYRPAVCTAHRACPASMQISCREHLSAWRLHCGSSLLDWLPDPLCMTACCPPRPASAHLLPGAPAHVRNAAHTAGTPVMLRLQESSNT
jgi:hypothetical protein